MPPDRAQQLHERLLSTFRVEAEEHLGVLGAELDALDDGATPADIRERVDVLFRTMHTLKGASRSVGITEVETICHLCEAMLRNVRDGAAATPALVTDLQDSCDAIAGFLSGSLAPGRIETVTAKLQGKPLPQTFGKPDDGAQAPEAAARSGEPEPPVAQGPAAQEPQEPEPQQPQDPHQPQDREAPEAPETPESAAGAAPAEELAAPRPKSANAQGGTIRVDVERLDALNVLAEDLLIPKLAMANRVKMARGLFDTVAKVRAQARSESRANGARAGANGREWALLDDRLRDVEASSRQLLGALRNDQRVMRASVDALMDQARHIRMVPAASMLEVFPRMVRDLARETGKDVAWQAIGADIPIDRKVLDQVKDPLIHMVRNAVDHGIETPAERVRAGKPERGRVTLSIEQIDGGRISISVNDDGRGLDLAAIRSAAVRSRAVSSEKVQSLSDAEVSDLVFRAGLSTTPVISNISGNGLGLAIVRERVERIEGRLSMASVPGRGTTIKLDLPAAIATYRGLLVGSGTSKMLWPSDSVERAIGVPAGELTESLARGSYKLGDAALPIGRLDAILGFEARGTQSDRRQVPAIVVRSAERRGILLVDEVLGDSEIVLKELRPPLRRVPNVMACGLLGTGELIIVARPSDVLASIHTGLQEARVVAARTPEQALRLLVVDDSITTRTMERNMFEAAGYHVRTAVDGVEALSLLQSEPFDLVVSDVDMPRMDGFQLTERLRGDERFAQLPVVLVTALESREDKERGVRIGANAYVLKSAFNQSNLLEIVQRLT